MKITYYKGAHLRVVIPSLGNAANVIRLCQQLGYKIVSVKS